MVPGDNYTFLYYLQWCLVTIIHSCTTYSGAWWQFIHSCTTYSGAWWQLYILVLLTVVPGENYTFLYYLQWCLVTGLLSYITYRGAWWQVYFLILLTGLPGDRFTFLYYFNTLKVTAVYHRNRGIFLNYLRCDQGWKVNKPSRIIRQSGYSGCYLVRAGCDYISNTMIVHHAIDGPGCTMYTTMSLQVCVHTDNPSGSWRTLPCLTLPCGFWS